MKLFANGLNLSFDNCEDMTPTQEFELTPADLLTLFLSPPHL